MTTTTDTAHALHVPARTIPVPKHLSAAAQAMLAMGRIGTASYPALDDVEGWRSMIAQGDQMWLTMLAERASRVRADVEQLNVGGVPVYSITPEGTAPDDRRVFLEVHGGSLIMGGGACCRATGLDATKHTQVRTWAIDYRMPPDHPYPTPLDDCMTVYRALLADHRPGEIMVGGSSAGGNLVSSLILRARDEGLPLPVAVVLISPEVDLTESGDSFHTNLGVDTALTDSLMSANLLYARGHDLADPYLSPLFGDFSRGFPPTLLATGTRDLFLSNTVRMHRKLRAAGIEAELHVLEAAPHGAFFLEGASEMDELYQEVRRFVAAHWG